MLARRPTSSVQSGASPEAPAWPAPVMRASSSSDFSIEVGDLLVAHQRLGLLQELIVAPSALGLELAQLGLERAACSAAPGRAGRRRPRRPRLRNRPCCTAPGPTPRAPRTRPPAAPLAPRSRPASSLGSPRPRSGYPSPGCKPGASGRGTQAEVRSRSRAAQNAGPNLLDLGKPLGASRPAWARWPTQSLSSDIGSVKVRPAGSSQASPSAFLNTRTSLKPPSL